MALGFGLRREGQAFDILIKRLSDSNNQPVNDSFHYLCTILYLGLTTRTIHAGFGIKNLPLGRYNFVFEPTAYLTKNNYDVDGLLIASFSDRTGNTFITQGEYFEKNEFQGGQKTYDLDLMIGGQLLQIKGDLYTLSDLEAYDQKYLGGELNTYSWEDVERNYEDQLPFTMIGVNEVVTNGNVLYPNISLLEVELKASEELKNPPKISLEIEEGTIIKCWFGISIVEQKISDQVFTYDSNQYKEVPRPELNENRKFYVLDPKRGKYAEYTSNNGEITISGNNFSQLEEGDEIVFYFYESSSLFSDIFTDLLLNKDYGLGKRVKERMIDWFSIIDSNYFCYQNNYFWDGVLESPQNLAQWVSREAPTCLLLPKRLEGKFGLQPENKNQKIKEVFNESNILKGSFTRSTVPLNQRELNKVVIIYTDGRDERKQKISLEVMSKGVYEGTESKREQKKNFSSITRFEQALDVAITSLNSAKIQTEEISFQTDNLALDISPGDLIAVQQRLEQYDYNGSSLITEAKRITDPDDDDFQIFEVFLTNKTRDNYNDSSYFAYVKYYQGDPEGEIYKFSILNTETISMYEDLLTNSDASNVLYLTPLSESNPSAYTWTPFDGDAILIAKATNRDITYRVQSIDFSEEGILIQALNWSEEIFKGTFLDDDRTESDIGSGYKEINGEYVYYRE